MTSETPNFSMLQPLSLKLLKFQNVVSKKISKIQILEIKHVEFTYKIFSFSKI